MGMGDAEEGGGVKSQLITLFCASCTDDYLTLTIPTDDGVCVCVCVPV